MAVFRAHYAIKWPTLFRKQPKTFTNMDYFPPVSPQVFEALQQLDVSTLSECTEQEVRPILPTLVRMSLIKPTESTVECEAARMEIFSLLTGIERTNSIVSLLSIDFQVLDVEVKKELQARQKPGNLPIQSQMGFASDFERLPSMQRLQIVISELFYIAYLIQENKEPIMKPSDLFDNAVFLPEICDAICIALTEVPAHLNVNDIVESMIRLKYGPNMACWIIANFPHHFRSVCTWLISNGERQDEETLAGRMRCQTIRKLCQMNPSQSLLVRAKCVEMCRMPGLAILLTLDQPGSDDLVAFISGLLLGSDQAVRNWFTLFIRSGQKRKSDNSTALQLMRDELLRQLTLVIQQGRDPVSLREGSITEKCVLTASAFLRLYSALRCVAGIKFHDEEVSLIVQLLTSRPPATRAGVRFVSLALCMFIACPALITVPEHERKAVAWVQWLVKGENYFENVSGAGFGEMLLLMAIHFHSNQLSAICDLVWTTLGVKVQNRSNNMTRLKQIFTQEIFTEQVVAAHAVKVPVTNGLHAGMTGYLPVHCIHQLLKSRAFAKHKVPIHNWLYKQICNTNLPLHPVLPGLIEVYVNSILAPSGAKSYDQVHTNRPLTENQIRVVFQNSVFGRAFDSKVGVEDGNLETPSLTSQLLLLYYLMLYEDTRLTNASVFAGSGRLVKIYSSEFLSELPIKYLLQQAQRDQSSLGGLFSSLLRLLATHFPHLALVDDWLDENSTPVVNKTILRPLPCTKIKSVFDNLDTDPARAAKLFRQLLNRPAIDVWPHAQLIVSYFPAILSSNVPQCLQESFKDLWLRLNTVLPRSLWVMTINSLLPKTLSTDNLTQENIAVDPLQALRVDQRVFRSAPALTIILRVLQASLAASRCHLARHILDHPLTEKRGQLTNEAEREELRLALISTQESLAVQILLEYCVEQKEDSEIPGQLLALREVRSVICSYLHQVFISDTGLAKLVHFQGYPRELLPVTVTGIPSMHICLDFIPELLSQPSLEKQVFAVDLASHLSVQFAVPKSFSVARLAINTLSTLLTVLPASRRHQLFNPVLPCLVRICGAFPPLAEDTVSFLVQLGRVASAQAALDCHESNQILCDEVHLAFRQVLQNAVLKSSV